MSQTQSYQSGKLTLLQLCRGLYRQIESQGIDKSKLNNSSLIKGANTNAKIRLSKIYVVLYNAFFIPNL